MSAPGTPAERRMAERLDALLRRDAWERMLSRGVIRTDRAAQKAGYCALALGVAAGTIAPPVSTGRRHETRR